MSLGYLDKKDMLLCLQVILNKLMYFIIKNGVRTIFHTVDARSSGSLRSAIHHYVHSNLLQKSEKRQRACRCFYREHSDAKVKI